jgi:DNA integrity scanning protein DisA with diadenylate cyclase activity
MKGEALIGCAVKLAEEIGADAIITSHPIRCGIPVICISPKERTLEGRKELENAALSAFLEGRIKGKVVGISGVKEPDSIFIIDPEKSFMKELGNGTLRALISLSLKLRRRKIGTAFIIGDTRKVLKSSHQLIINPFKGHPPHKRDIKNERNWETIIKFAKLDGVFVLNKNGEILAAGRYIDSVDRNIKLQPGLGGRHLSAASITKDTEAIAITISKNDGAVRIFKKGCQIAEL